MVELQNLSKSYKSSQKNKTIATNSINLVLPDNGLVSIVGKSGCGKTTLLNLIGALDFSDSGLIIYTDENGNKKNITAMNEDQLTEYRNHDIGFIFQELNLINEWTVEQNLRIVIEQKQKDKIPPNEIKQQINEILNYVDMNGMEKKYIKEMSGGQQQRVAIARAILKKPGIILADEPTGSLDSENSEMIMKLLKKYSRNCLVIVVSHDRDLSEKYSDRIITMSDGKIISDASVQQDDIFKKKTDGNCHDEKFEFFDEKNNKNNSLYPETILSLSLRFVQVKKIKLSLTVLALAIILSGMMIILQVLENNYGKAASVFLKAKGCENILPYREYDGISDGGIFYDIDIYNNDFVKSICKKYFGEECLVPVIQNAELVSPYSDKDFTASVSVGGLTDNAYEFKGQMPVEENEIVISDGIAFQLDYPEDCIGNKIILNGIEMVICGVYSFDFYSKSTDPEFDAWDELREYISDDGQRVIVSKKYLELVKNEKIIALPLIEFENNQTVLESTENRTLISSVKNISEDILLWGKIPENNNEVLLSLEYVENHLFSVVHGDFTQINISLVNWRTDDFNKILDGYLNLYDYFDDFKVVGIINTYDVDSADLSKADLYFTEEKFEIIKKDYIDKYFADAYEICLNNKNIKKYAAFDALIQNNIEFDEYMMDGLFEQRKEFINDKNLLMTVFCVLAMLYLILVILFFSMNVKDNHIQIGILRAIGCSKQDITKIWYTEAVNVSLLTEVLALLARCIFMARYNFYYMKHYISYIQAGIFFERFPVTLIAIIIVLGIAFMAVLLPIWIMTDKKPVELIRER